MKVALNEKITQPESPQPSPITFFRLPQYDSSITPLRSAPRNRVLAFFEAIKRKVIAFFNWIRSWFVSPPSKEKDVDYYKVKGPDGDEMRYRLVVDGEGTDTQIRLGQKYAFLQDITNVKNISKFSEMIDLMMKNEKIDGIQTKNLKLAHRLWQAGLKTTSPITFNLSSELYHTFIQGVIQKAIDNKSTLNAAAQNALLRVESKIISSIVDPLSSPSACRTNIDEVERFFKYNIDLRPLIHQAEAEKNGEYVKILKMIPAGHDNNIEPVTEYEFFLEDLFILMEATKTPMDRAIIQPLPTLTFTKRI